jgi:hypothetical protein
MIFSQEEDGKIKRCSKHVKAKGRKRSKKDVKEQKQNKRCQKYKEVVTTKLTDDEVFY